MKIHFTWGYHLEGDRQPERLNQTLEQYLHIFCNYQQDNWSELLPLAEFTYNNSPSTTTGVTPFFANKGYHPNIAIYSEREYVIDLEELHAELRTQMAKAQARYQGPADCWREPAPDFQVGQQVFVSAEYIHTTRPSKKLSEKYLGPFDIIARPGTHLFTLRLPDHFRAIHPVFHVSQLEPSYFIRWSGYEGTDEENSWLPATELSHAQELVSDFHSCYPNKLDPLTL